MTRWRSSIDSACAIASPWPCGARSRTAARGDGSKHPSRAMLRCRTRPSASSGVAGMPWTRRVAHAIERGYATITIEAPIVGEARIAGPRFLELALQVSQRLPRPVCVIASGETTVRVTGSGRGGRNQELALSAASVLATLAARSSSRAWEPMASMGRPMQRGRSSIRRRWPGPARAALVSRPRISRQRRRTRSSTRWAISSGPVRPTPTSETCRFC